MKALSTTVLAAMATVALLSLPACSGGREADSQTANPVTEKAHSDAARAVNAPDNSMEREDAILAIRAREHELRSNGYEAEADEYIRAAGDSLRSAGVIR